MFAPNLSVEHVARRRLYEWFGMVAIIRHDLLCCADEVVNIFADIVVER